MAVISVGNLCKCSFGTIPIPLVSTNITVQAEKSPVVTNMDTSNLISFGLCSASANPLVVEVAGIKIPTVCQAKIITPWLNTKMNVLACGKPICTNNSICQCKWGGIVTIINIKNFTVS